MKENLTELIYILDMSGSMNPLKNDTIGGFNSMIEEQKNAPGEAYVTTVLFNHCYEVLHDHVNINEVEEMNESTYIPMGATAMNDAIGFTIDNIGKRLAETPEEERPSKVIVTIVTDGYENASKEYSLATVKEKITTQREVYNWMFVFLGANIDTMKTTEDLGIDARFAKTYTASGVGTQSVYKSVSKLSSGARGVSEAEWTTMACMDYLSSELDEVK